MQGIEQDYIIADVHTQTTDEAGNIVGRVLHVGTGKVNLGVFLVPSPSHSFEYTAFVGPVMSYYEKITDQFDRMTDSRWNQLVYSGLDMPARPEWTNEYLADTAGQKKESLMDLPYTLKYSYTAVSHTSQEKSIRVYPNPAGNYLFIENTGEDINEITIITTEGKIILQNSHLNNASFIDLSGLHDGMYILKIKTGNDIYTSKIIKYRHFNN